jgi:3'(2'), 5'-bisphosphate nucleotidase
MTDVLDVLIDVVGRAAEIVREVYDTPFSVEYKAPRDPVTAADRRANELICRTLSQAFPGVPVVAEESDPLSFRGYRDADRIFFVDPLDGTKEFIDRNGEFVVMVGLVEGDRATVGVVHAPAQRRLWAGVVGSGAFRCDEGGPREPIRVSTVDRLADARIVASRSHRSEALESAVAAFGARDLVMLGSAGLKGAEIASGHADIYVGPGRCGKRWDVCAIDAIVTAAGGRVSNGFGSPFDYRSNDLENRDGLVVTNGVVHDGVLERLGALGLGGRPAD